MTFVLSHSYVQVLPDFDVFAPMASPTVCTIEFRTVRLWQDIGRIHANFIVCKFGLFTPK